MQIPRHDWWRAASVTRWQMRTRGLAVAAIVLAVLLAVALIFGARPARSLPLPTGSASPQPLGNGQYIFSPRSAHVSVGIQYQFALYTHCGLDWPVAVDFDGSFWDPIGPGPASDGNGNPPPGYSNPIDHGTMTLLSPTMAEYRGDGGAVMRFSRHPGDRTAYLCS